MEQLTKEDESAIETIREAAKKHNLSIEGGKVRRTSSRFCLSVEHGDYNGTELFGVGTDRFIWFAYKPNGTRKVRLFSANFPDDGVIEYEGKVPKPKSPEIAQTWGRFAYGTAFILEREGYIPRQGINGVIFGNIPGGGMSRSASLSLNLILSMLDANGIEIGDNHEQKLKVVDLAQAIENDYIGSPCGKLDQIMILFAKEGMGTRYNPKTKDIEYVKYGGNADDFRLVVLDTGTERPGLEKSTYTVRRAECEELVRLLRILGYEIRCLANIKDETVYNRIMERKLSEGWGQTIKTPSGRVQTSEENLKDRLNYIFHAQQRFYQMMEAWKAGDIETVGAIFSADGVGLNKVYNISGPELQTMVDIAHANPGVWGARMLGGGDKGASGAIVAPGGVQALVDAVNMGYPRSHPEYTGKQKVHVCKAVDGVKVFEGVLK